MKKLTLLLSLSFVFLLACEKDPVVGPGGNLPEGVSAVIDGEAWKATSAQAVFENGMLSIILGGADSSTISIYTDGFALKKYSFGTNEETNFAQYKLASQEIPFTSHHEEALGSLQILKMDTLNNKFSATFTFKLFHEETKEIIEIKNGSLNISYTSDVDPVTDDGGEDNVDGGEDNVDGGEDNVDGGEDTVDGVDGDSTSIETNVFSVKINDQPFNYSEFMPFKDGAHIILYGSSDTEGVWVVFPLDIAVGTYGFSEAENTYGEYYSIDGSYPAVNGSLVITKHDVAQSRIEGTFKFEGAHNSLPSVSIQEGTFSATYTDLPEENVRMAKTLRRK